MNLKKILFVCLALVLALAVTGCSSSKDIQAQLDAANVSITELQAPGKKRMHAADYLLGHPMQIEE